MMMSESPATILVIRHGEKPADKGNPHLSDEGNRRAQMLAATLPAIYPSLAALFATAPARDSNRPYETIAPLAKNLGLAIDNSFADNQHAELARKLLSGVPAYRGRTILVCWHHEKIPALVHDDLRQPDAPTVWPEAIFDRIWQIDYAPAGGSTFTIKPEPPMPAG